MKDEHKKYFENIISRAWAGGVKFNTKVDISKIDANSKIDAVYYEKTINDHVVFIAKSGHCFFLLEWHGNEDYKYSSIICNNTLVDLLKPYNKKIDIMGQADPTKFADSLMLQEKLETTLKKDNETKIKRTKI